MKKKCLVITYCYPPHQSPESYITGKFIRGISKYWEIDVLSLKYDEKLEKLWNTKKLNVFRLDIPTIFRKVLNIPRLPFRPDRFILLNRHVKRELKNFNLEKYDIFFTRSQFHSVHLIGLYLKKKFPKVKWITSFSDPWTNNPYQKNLRVLEYFNNYFKEKVLKKSDLLIFPLENLKDHFNQNSKHDIKKKSIIVPHSFDQTFFLKKVKARKFKISFFGKIYADRNIIPLFDSIEQLHNEIKQLEANFYIDSEFLINNKKLISHYRKYFMIKSYIPYSEYIKNVKNSSLLIVLDVDTNDGKYFFQSKLVDYLGSKNMILHVGKSDTYNKKLILMNNCFSCLNEKKHIKETITKIINRKRKFTCNKKLIDTFELKNVASTFIKKSKNFINDQ